MRRLLVLLLVVLTSLWLCAIMNAGTIKIGRFSDQATPGRAVVGAQIDTAGARDGGHQATDAHGQQAIATRSGRRARPSPGTHLPNPFPPLAMTSPILRNPQPAGPQSFWYSDGAGHACMYAPGSVLPCFTVIGVGVNAGAVALNPAAMAASVAGRLTLTPGQIELSPSRAGLAGAASWFWLDPAPQPRELSLSLGGETVRVVADPTEQWRFGDGATLDGGPGVPYTPGSPPADAIRHLYETRCLPGDQGRDPYVLPTCGQNGYVVEAVVVWTISYSAAGPIGASGSLPTRTTESSTVYPVSEARAFLVGGGG